jgi:hypothetical protein
METNGAGGGRGADRRLSVLDRCILVALGDGRTVGQQDDPAVEKYPHVWEWLSKTQGGQNHVLQPAVLTIQLGPEGVLVSLTHRDLRVSCSVACPYLDDVLPTLQEALSQPHPPLRTWGKDDPVLRKKRQK